MKSLRVLAVKKKKERETVILHAWKTRRRREKRVNAAAKRIGEGLQNIIYKLGGGKIRRRRLGDDEARVRVVNVVLKRSWSLSPSTPKRTLLAMVDRARRKTKR